jgi:glycosyltransferase involved in cell wall biosynthesis
MHIAEVAPLWETVPPLTYGGTERVVELLVNGLLDQGHTVTLFACGGTTMPAHPNFNLVTFLDGPMRHLGVKNGDAFLHELTALETIFHQAQQFDIIHNHMGPHALAMAGFCTTPTVTTLHGAFSPGPLQTFYADHASNPYISISDYQRLALPHLNYRATIYHGLDLKLFSPDYDPESKTYLAFLGRFSPEKGPHLAIEVAKATGHKLIMAGKTDPVDTDYYQMFIAPHVDNQQIFNIGEVNHDEKVTLLKNAKATLCPVTWPEPFGLVLIESMACGTPVIALRNGSIPEVVDHGQTGFIADDVDTLISYVNQLDHIDRHACRQQTESRFGLKRMIDEHIELYKALTNPKPCSPSPRTHHLTALQKPEPNLKPLSDNLNLTAKNMVPSCFN